MNPARFRWGVLFILVGGLLLLNNIGWLDWWVWGDILSLWPLILVAIGVEKIFARSHLEIISYLAPLALAGIVIWVAADSAVIDGVSFSDRGRSRYRIEEDDSLVGLVAKFQMDDCDLDVRPSRHYLFSTRHDGYGRPPSMDYDAYKDTGYLEVVAKKSWRIIRKGHRSSGGLDAYLTSETPLNIQCRGDDADMRLDCRELKVDKLQIISQAGNIKIYLGDKMEAIDVSLDGDDADFRLVLPGNSGLRVAGADVDLSQYLERLGLEDREGHFISTGYDTLRPQVNLEIDGGISHLSIDFQ